MDPNTECAVTSYKVYVRSATLFLIQNAVSLQISVVVMQCDLSNKRNKFKVKFLLNDPNGRICVTVQAEKFN
jgi:hypothetical protein